MHQLNHLNGDHFCLIQIDRLGLVDFPCGPTAQHAADLPLYFVAQNLRNGSRYGLWREKVVLGALELLWEEFFNLLGPPVSIIQIELLVYFLDVWVFEGRLAVGGISVSV